jgi:hypothetical protein
MSGSRRSEEHQIVDNHSRIERHTSDHREVTESSSSSPAHVHILWLLVDGVGLGVIAVCTLFEAYHDWRDTFSFYYSTNMKSVGLWWFGRCLQVIALFVLMVHAATFQTYAQIEMVGMFLLTAGPMLCIAASFLFKGDILSEPELYNLPGTQSAHFSEEWRWSEASELMGVMLLDASMVPSWPLVELTFEICGFFALGYTALTGFVVTDSFFLPKTFRRYDMLHLYDAMGLALLTMVGIADYCHHQSLARKPIQQFHRKKSLNQLEVGSYYSKSATNFSSANNMYSGSEHDGVPLLSDSEREREFKMI